VNRAVVPTLGLAAAAGIIVANLVGQGVFLKGRVMACETGTPSLELAAWGIAGLIAFCGALAFAELAAMMPESGGSYVYVRRAFGKPAAFVVAWAQILIAAPASIGALGSGGAIFFNHATGGVLDAIPAGAQVVAVLLIAAVTALNCAPVRVNGNVAIVSAVLKTFTLAAITAAGFAIGHHTLQPAHVDAIVTPGTCPDVVVGLRGGAGGFVAALLSALYAYNGWISVTGIAGEIRAPATTIPRALLVGVSLVVALYLLANAAFVRTLGFAHVLALPTSASIGIASAEALFGGAWGTISSIVLFASVVATLHIVVLFYSRIIYAVACDGMFPPILARLSKANVPVFAVLATSALATLLVLVMGFERLSDWFTFEVWLIFDFAVVGLFVLRRREPDAPRPYRVPGYPIVPASFLTAATYVLVVTTITRPDVALTAVAITLAGIPAYALVTRVRGGPDGS